MKNKNLIIKEVILAKNGTKEVSFYSPDVSNARTLIPATAFSFDIEKTITCVIDEENCKAIDLETNEVWDLIKRNDKGQILKEDYPKILSGEICALRTIDKNWEKISLLYQLDLKDRARKVYQKYLDNLPQKEDEKVYTIRKKREK